MAVNFTDLGTVSSVVTTDLNSLANDRTGVSSSTVLDNSASSNRDLLANFLVYINTQGGARDSSAKVYLLIVPSVNSQYPTTSGADATADLKLAEPYKARYADGTVVSWDLDAVTTARYLPACGVQIPNAPFKVGILNETGQALAASGNIISMSTGYSHDDV